MAGFSEQKTIKAQKTDVRDQLKNIPQDIEGVQPHQVIGSLNRALSTDRQKKKEAWQPFDVLTSFHESLWSYWSNSVADANKPAARLYKELLNAWDVINFKYYDMILQNEARGLLPDEIRVPKVQAKGMLTGERVKGILSKIPEETYVNVSPKAGEILSAMVGSVPKESYKPKTKKPYNPDYATGQTTFRVPTEMRTFNIKI